MGKVLGSWSGMRKYLEKEMLAPSLKGRIRYNCTRYIGMDDCFIFEIFVDNKLLKQFSWETVNTYFIENGYKQNKNPVGTREYWDEFWNLLDRTPLCVCLFLCHDFGNKGKDCCNGNDDTKCHDALFVSKLSHIK